MSTFLTIALIHQLAVMSPGPDFALTVRNSIVHGRRGGIWTAAGFALGILVHVTYCLLGVGLLIARSILLFNIVKYLGAAYLLYVGWKALTAKHQAQDITAEQSAQRVPGWKLLWSGFLCNVLNPKATLFMFALFTQVIDPQTPVLVQAFYGAYMGLSTFVWFGFVASVLTLDAIRTRIARVQIVLERAMGAVLLALGIRVALSTRD